MGNHIEQSSFHATPHQRQRLEERRTSTPREIICADMNILVYPGVYQTSGDSELMIESVQILPTQSFLEIGCGTGVVSLAIAMRAKRGVAVDINEETVENSKQNAERLQIENVTFAVSNVFENVQGKFDIIICNPPYTRHKARDVIEKMFWDPEDKMKQRFFSEAEQHLNTDGRIYFGWANFADINVNLPFELAKSNGYKLVNIFRKPHSSNDFSFFVMEFRRNI